MSQFVTQVKHRLNIRPNDFFVAYGMGASTRQLVSALRGQVDVSVGIIAEKDEGSECDGLKTKIYDSINDIGGTEVFDKVYCNFCQLPTRKQHHESVLDLCYKLCAPGGMVLVENMNKQEFVHEFVRKANIQKFWYMNAGNDLLFKKDSKIV